MNDNECSEVADETPRRVPVKLAKRTSEALNEMLTRVFPDNGVSPIDVCGFQSSI